jgi:hypothetical protein
MFSADNPTPLRFEVDALVVPSFALGGRYSP